MVYKYFNTAVYLKKKKTIGKECMYSLWGDGFDPQRKGFDGTDF